MKLPFMPKDKMAESQPAYMTISLCDYLTATAKDAGYGDTRKGVRFHLTLEEAKEHAKGYTEYLICQVDPQFKTRAECYFDPVKY